MVKNQSFVISAWLTLIPLAFVVTAAMPEDAPAPKPSPHFTGTALPIPPQQKSPWTPPKSDAIPAPLISAMRALFDAGLADPRGCEYRAVKLAAGTCGGNDDADIADVHAFVLPAIHGTSQRFAVAWNGLVYPLINVGPPANLHADVAKVLHPDPGPGNGFVDASRESMTSPLSLFPIKCCLLLRLGDADDAGSIWNAWLVRRSWEPQDDPLLLLAGDWVWARFDRAIDSHMRADDHLSLIDTRAIGPMVDTLTATAKARHLKPLNVGAPEVSPRFVYFPFADTVNDLLPDQERRARENHADLAADPSKITDQAQRIRLLIRRLDQVQSGRHDPTGTVDALIREGDAAVDPLLDCVEHDNRMTRAVIRDGKAPRWRWIIPVQEAAAVAVCGILQRSFDRPVPTVDPEYPGFRGPTRAEVVKWMRAYWAKYRNVPLRERWYKTLRDDNDPDGWLEAAQNITRPAETAYVLTSPYGDDEWGLFDPIVKHPRVMWGESLRALHDPSVSDLIAKRMKQASAGPARLTRDQRIGNAAEFAKTLALWNGAAHHTNPTR